MRNATLMMVALALLCSTPVFAGGGGAKKNATLRVRNNGGGQIAVLLDPSATDLAFFAVAGNATQANLQNRGGRLVNAGAQTNFLVTGNAIHTVFVAFTADVARGPDGQTGGGSETETPSDDVSIGAGNANQIQKVTGGAGSITTVTVTGNPGAPPLLALLLNLGREVAFASIGLAGIAVLFLAGLRLQRA